MCTPSALPTSTSTMSTVAAIQTFMERKNIRFIPFAVVVRFFTPLSRKQQKGCHFPLRSKPPESRPRAFGGEKRKSCFSDKLSRKADWADFSDTGKKKRGVCAKAR